MAEGYDPRKSKVGDDAMETWRVAPVDGDLIQGKNFCCRVLLCLFFSTNGGGDRLCIFLLIASEICPSQLDRTFPAAFFAAWRMQSTTTSFDDDAFCFAIINRIVRTNIMYLSFLFLNLHYSLCSLLVCLSLPVNQSKNNDAWSALLLEQ